MQRQPLPHRDTYRKSRPPDHHTGGTPHILREPGRIFRHNRHTWQNPYRFEGALHERPRKRVLLPWRSRRRSVHCTNPVRYVRRPAPRCRRKSVLCPHTMRQRTLFPLWHDNGSLRPIPEYVHPPDGLHPAEYRYRYGALPATKCLPAHPIHGAFPAHNGIGCH